MANNLIQAGAHITLAATADVVAGAGMLAGSLFGVAVDDALTGEDVVLATDGVYELPKTSAQAWTVGVLVYWDNSNKVVTTATSGNKLIGVAVEAAANPSATGKVRLNGSFTQ